DGENDAVFPPYSHDGARFGEYIGDRGIHADLPLEEIEKVFQEKYGIFKHTAKGIVQLDTKNNLI
ncbi:hypothetical protein LCGC14_2060230, partial [marine sediment metagenome]